MHPSGTVFSTPVSILGGIKELKSTNIMQYILTFDVQVWVAFIVTMVIMCFLATALEYLSDGRINSMRKFREKLGYNFWRYFENMFCESSPRTPDRDFSRILCTFWWICIIVLMNSFAGQMSACLMAKSDSKKIESMENLAANTHIKPYVVMDSSIGRTLQEAPIESYRKVYNMVQKFGSSKSALDALTDDVLEDVQKGTAIMIHAQFLLRHAGSSFCLRKGYGMFYVGKQPMLYYNFLIYFRRSFPEKSRRIVNRAIKNLNEAGILRKMILDQAKPLDVCERDKENIALTFTDMVSFFYLMAGVNAGCIAVFIAEVVFYHIETKLL